MKTVIVTGGLGAGKSTACERFRDRGASVISADGIARGLLSRGSATLARVVEQFGEGILTGDGALDRTALAKRVFADPNALERLDAIVHPGVRDEIEAALCALETLPAPPGVVVLEVPLLVEAPYLGDLADITVAIEAPVETRVARCVARGMSEDDARARIAAQATDADREDLADVVLVNDEDTKEFERRLDKLWEAVTGRLGRGA